MNLTNYIHLAVSHCNVINLKTAKLCIIVLTQYCSCHGRIPISAIKLIPVVNRSPNPNQKGGKQNIGTHFVFFPLVDREQ